MGQQLIPWRYDWRPGGGSALRSRCIALPSSILASNSLNELMTFELSVLLNGTWTFRTLDYSYPGLFVQSMDYSYRGLFVPSWTVRTMDYSYHHWTIRTVMQVSQKLTFPIKMCRVQCESWIFLTFSPKRLGLFSPNFTFRLYIPIYAGLQVFI